MLNRAHGRGRHLVQASLNCCGNRGPESPAGLGGAGCKALGLLAQCSFCSSLLSTPPPTLLSPSLSSHIKCQNPHLFFKNYFCALPQSQLEASYLIPSGGAPDSRRDWLQFLGPRGLFHTCRWRRVCSSSGSTWPVPPRSPSHSSSRCLHGRHVETQPDQTRCLRAESVGTRQRPSATPMKTPSQRGLPSFPRPT